MDPLHFLLIGLVLGLVAAMRFLGRAAIDFVHPTSVAERTGCSPFLGVLIFIVLATFVLGGSDAFWAAFRIS